MLAEVLLSAFLVTKNRYAATGTSQLARGVFQFLDSCTWVPISERTPHKVQ